MSSAAHSDPTDDKHEVLNVLTPLEMLGFAARAAKRHVRLGLSVSLGIVALGLAISKIIPQKFAATSRILADETFIKTEALSAPEHALPNLNPFSGSLDLVTQKSVLISIIDDAGLLADAETRQNPLLEKVDAFINKARGRDAPSFDEKRDAMATNLAAHIKTKMSKDMVTIQVDWPNARKAVQIVQALDSKLIELLRNRDAASITAAVSILEDESKRASEAIEPALAEFMRQRDQNQQAAAAPDTPDTSMSPQPVNKMAPAQPAQATEAALAQARQYAAKLGEINGKVQTIENAWRRRQETLNARLAELKTVYGPEHPQVIQEQTLINSAAQPPEELMALQRTRSELLSEIQNAPEGSPKALTNRFRATGRAQNAPRTIASSQPNPGAAGMNDNVETSATKAKLVRAIESFSSVEKRLATARLQLISSQATFGMRFVVVDKPELPPGPLKPLRMLVRFAALGAGLLFGFLAGALRELASGKIHETLQLKPLGLKNLGELTVFKPSER